MPQGDVVAAGAVVLRRGASEALVVHRPRYDDWAWPKGKQDRGEHVTATAVREVAEETGLRIRLGRPLGRQLYPLADGRAKTVHYWVGRVRGASDLHRIADEEVDEVRWLAVRHAASLLTYEDDRALLDRALRHPRRTAPLVVVRHAAAQDRRGWDRPDPLRPLTAGGERQAEALAPVLGAYGVNRLLTSPSRRCVQTLEPYGIAAERVRALSEEDRDGDRIRPLLDDVLASRRSTALCTHRPVLPIVLDHLGVAEEPLAPGELVVAHHRRGRVVATERHLPGACA
ncbi:MAG: NUDIX hydrolase [Marmoricola sp.]